MSQKYDFGGEEDFFASGYSNSGAAKKNFFDFEDEEPTESLSGLPESSSSLSARAQPPKTPPSSGFSQKKPVLPHGAISSSSSSSFSNELPSNSSSLFDFKCNNAARKVAELVELTIGGDRGPSTSLSSFSPTSTTTSTTTLSPRMAIEKLASAETDHHQSSSQQINLSVFRGKEQKLELLDYALLTGRPYVITRVILFLRETLKASLFHYEISRRPVASDHYLLFLRNTGEGAQEGATVQESLARLGRHEEAAFATYARAIKAGGSVGASTPPPSSNQAESQIRLLKKALQGFTSGGAEVLQWGPYIRDQIALLEQQLPIEADDRRREAEEIGRLQDPKVQDSSSSSSAISNSASSSSSSSNLFVLFPRPPLIGLSVLETLHYCCRYHYLLADNNFASPVYLRKRYGLSERQFLWTALQALSKSAMWPEIDTLFEYKSWLGSRKIKNCIPIEDIVGVLYRHSAPPEMLEKYLELIEDTERRLALAKELLMVKFAADILIKLKDRKRLSELRAAIQTSQDVDYVQRYIDNVLRTSTIKWKN